MPEVANHLVCSVCGARNDELKRPIHARPDARVPGVTGRSQPAGAAKRPVRQRCGPGNPDPLPARTLLQAAGWLRLRRHAAHDPTERGRLAGPGPGGGATCGSQRQCLPTARLFRPAAGPGHRRGADGGAAQSIRSASSNYQGKPLCRGEMMGARPELRRLGRWPRPESADQPPLRVSPLLISNAMSQSAWRGEPQENRLKMSRTGFPATLLPGGTKMARCEPRISMA